ncbi:hypothetical protein LGT39_04820 [Demequina sp. TTPB684]|uniref:hypothetical protein n=1 Tax=unclassified Demequina TaxID=2620311 RepID=UPI001CF20033|nr:MULTISPECIES: hypothetical protein [unclassified Demequina]MCB2412172.1 hypothetical protein [Demequina sp. TTPB684]UPU89637.1 hypothetical protein LGT36_006835 [Demequina sp. TMPB413]
MSTNPHGQWSRRALERSVAPHIDPDWAEAMLLELRLLGVSGPAIGAALAEVDSHCLDSGQTAQEAFGDPVAYAKSLGLATESEASPHALLLAAAPVLVQVLGMLLLLPSFAAWRAGALAQFSIGTLVSTGLLFAFVAVAIRWMDVLLRAVAHSPVAAWAMSLIPLALFAAAHVLFPANALQLPPAWPMTLALALLACGAAWFLVSQRDDADDPVTAPLAPASGTVQVSGTVRVMTAGLVPLATLAMLAILWWTTG